MAARREEVGGLGEGVRGFGSTHGQVQNSPGNAKYSTGNTAAREPPRMTHGHERWWGDGLKEWGCRVEGAKGEKSG